MTEGQTGGYEDNKRGNGGEEEEREAKQIETSKNVSSVYLRYGYAEAELRMQGSRDSGVP